MKTLIVLRHAKSSWKDPDLDDIDRPLNKRGKRDAPLIGKRLAERKIRPDRIVVSPARRARATVKAVAKQLPVIDPVVAKDERLYEASPATILAVVQDIPEPCACAMIVGHNPGLTDFVNQFADAVIDNIPTCGVVEIAFDTPDWRRVGAVRGSVVSFEMPKKPA
jgi:phosphohistidine phosphatase